MLGLNNPSLHFGINIIVVWGDEVLELLTVGRSETHYSITPILHYSNEFPLHPFTHTTWRSV